MRLMLVLQYSGYPYGGWQHQPASGTPKLPSVQGVVCEALNKLLVPPKISEIEHSNTRTLEHSPLQPRDLVAAGRTDAGVNAWAQVVHVDVPDTFANRPAYSWAEGLNRYLPHTIRAVKSCVVDETFHARYSATSRAYVYKLWVGRQLRPDLLHHAGHLLTPIDKTLDTAAMQAAIGTLPIGIATDFSSFRDAQCQSKNPICTLTHAHLEQTEPQLLTLHIGADHFLHHMVRNIVGTLAEVARGKREADLRPLIKLRDRTQAGTTFSPDGLYLAHVGYPAPYTLD